MIKIATYNIWESPAGMPLRFVQIVNEIVNQNADIICLQDELALQCQYPYFCFYPQTGLLILSRLPIEAYNKGDRMEGNRKGAGK